MVEAGSGGGGGGLCDVVYNAIFAFFISTDTHDRTKMISVYKKSFSFCW